MPQAPLPFRILLGVAVGVLSTLSGAPDAAAQATGLPTFYAPTRAFGTSEWGLSLSRPAGSSTGVEARFAAALDRADLNLRAGYADSGGSADGSFLLGAEVRLPVLGRSERFPLDGAFIFGIGYAIDPEQTIVPLGLSLGRRIDVDSKRTRTPRQPPCSDTARFRVSSRPSVRPFRIAGTPSSIHTGAG